MEALEPRLLLALPPLAPSGNAPTEIPSYPSLPVGVAATLVGPTITSPGTSTDTGSTVVSLTPTMNWNSVSGATKYGLYISKSPYGAANIIYSDTSRTGTTFTLPAGTLQNGVKYRWNMTSFNASGEGSPNNTLYFQTALVGPTVTSPGTSADTSATVASLTPTMNWGSVTGANTYGLYISKSPYGAANIIYSITSLTGTSFTLPVGTLQGGIKYKWNMTTFNSASAEGSVGNSLFFQTPIAALAGPTITSPGTDSDTSSTVASLTPTMNWGSVTGANTYGLYISKSPYGAANIIYSITSLTGTSFTLPVGTLQGGIKYKWNMTTFNSANTEGSVGNALYFQTPGVAVDDYPYSTSTPDTVDPYGPLPGQGFYIRECTSYVAWRMNRDAGTTSAPYSFTNHMLGGHWGDASNWDDNARLLGYTVDHVPAVGAIAQWNSINHVAYVESVNGDETVNVSEYNYYSSSNPFTWSQRSSLTPDWFIHINGVSNLPGPKISNWSPTSPTVSTLKARFDIYGENFADGATIRLRDSSDPNVAYDFSYTQRSDRYHYDNAGHIWIEPILSAAGTWSLEIINDASASDGPYNFIVSAPNVAVTGKVDSHLLDLIDQLAPTYYKSTWELSVEQYKAWIATIAQGEGGSGAYTAHSQGAPGSDVFDHQGSPTTFRFSTGLGPFQLDNGGGAEDWTSWKTIDKLDPARSVESVLRWHFSRFGPNTTLSDFSASSLWFSVKSNSPYGNVSARWLEVTGTQWSAQSAASAALDWSSTKAQLASNATGPSFDYASNVRNLGLRYWSIDAADNIKTAGNIPVVLVGSSPTWLITARSAGGQALFDYYYTYVGNIEIWVLANSSSATYAYRYAFVREYNLTQYPQNRSGNVAGVTLASPALDSSLSASSDASYSFSGPTGSETLAINAGIVSLAADASSTKPNLSVIVGNGAAIVFETSQHLAALDLAGGTARFSITNTSAKEGSPWPMASAAGVLSLGGQLLVIGDLSITNDGTLNLGNNDLVLLGASTSASNNIRQMIFDGRLFTNAAPTATLAEVDNRKLHLTTWGTETISDGSDFGEVIVKYTYIGDANMDGKVTQADYLNVLSNMGHAGDWLGGDLNHDGYVTVDDFASVSANMGAGAAFAAGPALVAPAITAPTTNSVAREHAPVAKKPVSKARQSAKRQLVLRPKRPVHADLIRRT